MLTDCLRPAGNRRTVRYYPAKDTLYCKGFMGSFSEVANRTVIIEIWWYRELASRLEIGSYADSESSAQQLAAFWMLAITTPHFCHALRDQDELS